MLNGYSQLLCSVYEQINSWVFSGREGNSSEGRVYGKIASEKILGPGVSMGWGNIWNEAGGETGPW